MKRVLILTAAFLTACQAGPQSSNIAPQSFADLLEVTDKTDTPICTLPIMDIKSAMPLEAWTAQMETAFDFQTYIKDNPGEFSEQIRVILRRAALKRRLSVESDKTELADGFYNEIDAKAEGAVTLAQFHDGFHYYMDRISEQDKHGNSDSAAFNLRYCVLNEYRADLHAASRSDLIARIKAGVELPNPDLIENINHEGIYGEAFRADMMAQIFNSDSVSNLSPLDIAKMRGDMSIYPSDPKTAEAFWAARDKEIDAYLNYLSSYEFSAAADKLSKMTDIDQSLRKMFSDPKAVTHFENAKEFDNFKTGIGSRVFKVDNFNTAELKSMLKNRGWFRDDVDGPGAGSSAWLIAQHADRNPEFQQDVLTLIEAELGAPGVSKSNYAYLYDRVQMRFTDGDLEGRVQRYGTQGRCTGPGTWEPLPVEEPARIDEVRAEVGLGTIAEYKARFKNICTEDQR